MGKNKLAARGMSDKTSSPSSKTTKAAHSAGTAQKYLKIPRTRKAKKYDSGNNAKPAMGEIGRGRERGK